MTWERGTLADFMGDCVVYRNLEPMHEGIEGLKEVWDRIGLDHYYVPRKTAPEYAHAMLDLLAQAQAQRGISSPFERLLFVGDTLMNDGTAARNVGQTLALMGFIGSQREAEPRTVDIQGDLMVANRWGALADYIGWVRDAGFVCDERTALLIDLDKTSLGARGRNDKVIDGARVRAVQRTMKTALGDRFSEAAFRALYDPLNQPAYHYFTADNQDYLAYICLMVTGGVFTPDEMWMDLESKAIESIEGFVAACGERRDSMSPGLLQAHNEVEAGIAAQDPTPFKGFRRGEYLETIACMDVLGNEATEADVLKNEIVITAEVASVATRMAEQGVLVFGISDKPDEASVPSADQMAQGMAAIHRTPMKVYGESII